MNLLYLKTRNEFNQLLVLPIDIMYIKLGREFNQLLKLETLFLVKLSTIISFYQKITLPEKLEYVKLKCTMYNTHCCLLFGSITKQYKVSCDNSIFFSKSTYIIRKFT